MSRRSNVPNRRLILLFWPKAPSSERLLETQHTQLKRKLAEVEEDVLLKSGEIKVLRDSLRSAQHQVETQRLKQIQVQDQQQKEQSLREKELLKKLQSLESQLQFKEAELNDMRSRVLSERRSSPLSRNSPKLESSASPSGGFITKESFSVQVKPTQLSANHSAPGPPSANRTPSKSHRQEVTRADPFTGVRTPRARQPGGVLLGLLLQPVSQKISLCHLLSLTRSLVGGSGDVISSGSGLSPVQSLALTGLNMMSLNRTFSSGPGALLLLPLLRSHLSSLCSSPDATGAVPACTSSVPQCTRSKLEEQVQSHLSPEEGVLVSLRTLTTLLQHSPEVVEAVLSEESQKTSTDVKALDCVSQSALLRCVLRLCRAPQKEVTCAALTTLQVLVQKSPETEQDRLCGVLSEVCVCLSADQRLKVVSLCVSVLTSLSDLSDLSLHLCSQHDPCVVLKLLQFVRSRSDPEATHSDWVQLDLKVVRFLSRILTQKKDKSTNINCTCYSELVQCVVLVLHRLWLDLRSSQAPPTSAQQSGRVQASLRETVLLFHWLLQNHSGFTENVRGVFHLYDQVIPALRESVRASCYSQELALDEICRSEPDDDMDTDSGS
ncbi:ATR-interacting protein [Eucyclogobius newberryi]|uniref:ATR-interacting protein n=1 Tax=Eucyclogobius newberryi TaxID=166745 RepID=UPI003B5CBFFE